MQRQALAVPDAVMFTPVLSTQGSAFVPPASGGIGSRGSQLSLFLRLALRPATLPTSHPPSRIQDSCHVTKGQVHGDIEAWPLAQGVTTLQECPSS